jgi:iron complex outermembrane recepter protein
MSGLGLQANFTFVDSSTKLYTPIFQEYCSGAGGAANLNLNLNGCDTDGRTFGNLPLQGLSRRAYNLAVFYEKNKFSARMAYSWRSKALQAVNANGTNGGDALDTNPASAGFNKDKNIAWALPTWVDDYGQLDASIFYNITDNLRFGFEAQNLSDSTYRQLMDQHIGTKGRAWFKSGPRYVAKVSYSF